MAGKDSENARTKVLFSMLSALSERILIEGERVKAEHGQLTATLAWGGVSITLSELVEVSAKDGFLLLRNEDDVSYVVEPAAVVAFGYKPKKTNSKTGF